MANTKKSPKSRKPNYASKNTEASERKQRLIMALLDASGTRTITVREIADALGLSRPLVHYHIRKLAYRRMVVVMMEPADAPGVLRFRLWSWQALQQAGVPVLMAA